MPNNEKSEQIKKILIWSSQLTGEGRRDYKYYWPKEIRSLSDKLRTVNGALVCITGLQGTGKTTALHEIQCKLQRKVIEDSARELVHQFTWPGGNDWCMDLHNKLQGLGLGLPYEQNYAVELSDHAKTLSARVRGPFARDPRVFSSEWSRLDTIHNTIEHYIRLGNGAIDPRLDSLDDTIMQMEALCKNPEKKELKKKALINTLSFAKTILIDTRDYSRSDSRAMTSDLTSIQELWRDMTDNLSHNFPSFKAPNLIIAIQKELYDKGLNFFLGKFDIVELHPLEPEELVRAYRLQWGSVYPFTPESLLLVAKLARGVFRRFLRYISLSIESKKGQRIKEKAVLSRISPEELAKDMEQELKQLFPRSREMQGRAAKLLYLLTGERLPQNKIARKLATNEMNVSRILEKLESHNYVERRRGVKAEKVVQLALGHE